jgi:hypothetical protein
MSKIKSRHNRPLLELSTQRRQPAFAAALGHARHSAEPAEPAEPAEIPATSGGAHLLYLAEEVLRVHLAESLELLGVQKLRQLHMHQQVRLQCLARRGDQSIGVGCMPAPSLMD